MPELQTVFYIVSIVFMSLALILIVVLVVALLAVKKKISAIHEAIDHKLDTLSRLSDKGAVLMGAIKRVATIIKK